MGAKADGRVKIKALSLVDGFLQSSPSVAVWRLGMLSVVVGMGEVVIAQRPSVSVEVDREEQPPVDVVGMEKQKVSFVPSADQAELRQIRLRLKMTKQTFSAALKIKQCTLESYEYGKTKGVPTVYMDRARELEKKNADETTKLESLDKLPMSQILEQWAEKLHVPVDNASILGALLNTTPTTIRRWRENKVRPDISRLSMLDSIVNSGPDGAKKAIAIGTLNKLKSHSASADGASFMPIELYERCVEKLSAAVEGSATGVALLDEFKTTIASCERTSGQKVFIQVTTFTLNRFVKRFKTEFSMNDEDTAN